MVWCFKLRVTRFFFIVRAGFFVSLGVFVSFFGFWRRGGGKGVSRRRGGAVEKKEEGQKRIVGERGRSAFFVVVVIYIYIRLYRYIYRDEVNYITSLYYRA